MQTTKKIAEANESANDTNQKTKQALDTLVDEHSTFKATMKKVKFEHKEGDVLHAVASEVADEQDRLQVELDCSCEDLATASRESSNCWAAQEAAT